jgi:hypothetical protein
MTPNRSRASSIIPRREIRLPAVKVTSAACKPAPNAEAPTSAASRAVVLVSHPGQCSRWVRCSGHDHADRRQLRDLMAPEPRSGMPLI